MILTMIPSASPIFAVEATLHLIEEGRITDEGNRINLLLAAYRRASSASPPLPLTCRACDQGTASFAIVAASRVGRDALSLKTTIISRLQSIDAAAALRLTEELSWDGSMRVTWNAQPDPPLFFDTRAVSRQLASVLIRNRSLLPSDEEFRTHLYATLSNFPPTLRVRTLGHILLMSRALASSLAADLRSQMLVDLLALNFDSLRQEDFDLTLLTILKQVSDRFPGDPSFLLNWATTYSHILLSSTGSSTCVTAAKITTDQASSGAPVPVEPSDGHRSEIEKVSYISYFVSTIAKPLGLSLPKQAHLDEIQGCIASLPKVSATPVSMPPGTPGLLRPLFRYKESVYSPSASTSARDGLLEADATVSRYLSLLTSGNPASNEKPETTFLSRAAAFMMLTSVLSDEVWFSDAWEAYVNFMDGADEDDIREFLWLGQISPMVTLISQSAPSEDALLRRSRGEGLVPSFAPLSTRRHEAIAVLKRARSSTLRLLGAIQEVVPFQYTFPREMRARLEQ